MAPRSRLSDTEQALVDAAISLAARLDVDSVSAAVLDVAEALFEARASWILLHDPGAHVLRTVAYRGVGADSYGDAVIPCDRGIVGLVFTKRETVFVPVAADDERWFDVDRVRESGLQSVFTVPLLHDDEEMGVLGLDTARFTAEHPPEAGDVAMLRGIAALAAIGIKNGRLFQEAEEDRERLRRLLHDRRQLRNQVGHLKQELRDTGAFSGVVGDSPTLRQVLAQVEVVAPADTTVLLVGETGTGKELVARAIHERSRRARAAFVAVNCAALPEQLVESELFGHEKGAFTGAIGRKPGKFELADKGTLLLDEIGDLPAEAQAKLLRVLQEREVHRVGSVRGVPVNVRVIAATNSNLEEAMTAGRFRPDLFYRLSVFPIVLPPLRERREDIPGLVEHFVRQFAVRLHTPTPRVSDAALEKLQSYDWPGNIRELQNVVERAVILSRGQTIRSELLPIHAQPVAARLVSVVRPFTEGPRRTEPALSFSDAERAAIQRALNLSAWRISGRGGAAELLGLKPTTLHAKMKKLGIRRPSASA